MTILKDDPSWKEAVRCASQDRPVLLRAKQGWPIKIALVGDPPGLPKTIPFHFNGRCGPGDDEEENCDSCQEHDPRRTVTVLNVFEFTERRLRLLICDENLTLAIYNAITHNDYSLFNSISIMNQGKIDESISDPYYKVELGPMMMPEDMAFIESLALIDVDDRYDSHLRRNLF